MKTNFQTFLGLPLLLPAAAFAAEEPAAGVKPDLLYVSSELLERANPDYPGSALSRGEEGWVQMSFIVTKDGVVAESMVKDSSGNEAIEKAAIKALNKWKFKPATVGGEPVDSSETQAIMRFEIQGNGEGVSRSFVRKYREVMELIKSGNLAEAETKITDLRFAEKYNLYEDAWFWWLDTLYADAIGDKDRKRESVQKSLAMGDTNLPGDLFLQASQTAYIVNVENFSFKDALTYLDKLKASEKSREVESFDAVVGKLEEHAAELRAFIDGEQIIQVAGKIDDNSYWYHSLARHVFSIGEVQGKVEAVEIRCNFYQTRRYEFVADVEWNIPASWQDCSLFVRGDPATTFTLYELPPRETSSAE
ncbi:MAG: energy transducer TonB [Pseudomonadota bacterium]